MLLLWTGGVRGLVGFGLPNFSSCVAHPRYPCHGRDTVMGFLESLRAMVRWDCFVAQWMMSVCSASRNGFDRFVKTYCRLFILVK